MTCCDEYGNCNQGRDCPIRGAKVARVRNRQYDRQELPPTTWRNDVRSLATWVLYGVLGLFWLAYVVAVVRWAYA